MLADLADGLWNFSWAQAKQRSRTPYHGLAEKACDTLFSCKFSLWCNAFHSVSLWLHLCVGLSGAEGVNMPSCQRASEVLRSSCFEAGLVATTLVIVIDRSSIQMLKGLDWASVFLWMLLGTTFMPSLESASRKVSTGSTDGLSRLQRIYLSAARPS